MVVPLVRSTVRFFVVIISLIYGLSSSAQTHQWAFDIPVGGATNAQSIITAQATDDSSNVYIGGKFRGTIYLGTDTFTFNNGSNYAIFLAKYDKDGDFVWGEAITTAAAANISKILINSSNQVLLYGSYLAGTGSVTFGSYTLSRSAGVFLAFMNPNGTFTSAKDLAFSFFLAAGDIALGPNDEVHALMYLSGFGGGWSLLNGASTVSGSGYVRAVAKYNSTATSLLWHNAYSSNDVNGVGGIDVDRHGQIYFLASIVPNRTVLGTLSSSTNTNYLIWLRPNGSFHKKLVSASQSSAFSAIDEVQAIDSNTIYLAGHAYGDSLTFAKRTIYSLTADPLKSFNFIAELKDFDTLTWARSTSHQGYGQVGTYRMTINGDFLYFSSPQNSPTFSFAGFTRSSFTRTVVSKFDRLGNLLWYLPIQSVNAVFINPMGTQDMVYSSEYTMSLTLSPFVLPTISGTGRSFMARTFDYSITRGEVASGPYCAGDTLLIPYERAGDFDTANTFIAELSDDRGEFFGGQRELGRLKYNEDSTITGILPLFQVASSNKYRIRIRSTHPVVQSYYRLDTLNLLIYSRDDADPGPDTSVCYGDTISLSTFGGTTWKWSPAYNMIDSTSRTPLVFPLVDTVYQIIIGDSSGCGAPDTADIRVSITPSPIFKTQSQTDTLVCKNQVVKLNTTYGGGVGDYYLQWYNNGTLIKNTATVAEKDSINLNIRVNSNVYVVLTDSCSTLIDTAFFTIMLHDSMVIGSLPSDTLVCTGQLFESFASVSHTFADTIDYLWRVGNITLSTDSFFNYTPTGSEIIRLSINNKCNQRVVNSVFALTTHPLVSAEIANIAGSDTFCANDEIVLASVVAGGNPSNAIVTQWVLAADTFLGDTFRVLASNLLSQYPLQQDFDVQLVASDGCSVPDDTAEYAFHMRRPVMVDSLAITDTLLCNGDMEISRLFVSGGSSYDFGWVNGSTILSDIDSLILERDNLATGVGSIKAKVKDGCGFQDSILFSVFVPEDLSLELLGDSILCSGVQSIWQVSSEGGLQSDIAYTWSTIVGGTTSNDSFLFDGIENTLFTDSAFTLLVSVADGCVDAISDSLEITVQNTPVVSLTQDSMSRGQVSDTIICRGNSPIFTSTSYYDNQSDITWLLDGVVVSSLPIFAFSTTYEESKSEYTLQAVVYDTCSNTSDTATLFITLRDSLSLSEISDTLVCFGTSLQLSAEATGGDETYTYMWAVRNTNEVLSNDENLNLSGLSQSVDIRLTLDDGCTAIRDTVRFTVNVRDSLQVSILASDSCTNETIELVAELQGGLSTDYQYAWYYADELLSDTRQISVEPSSISVYKVVLSDGCSLREDSAVISCGPKPQFEVEEVSDGCEPLTIYWEANSLSTDEYTFEVLDESEISNSLPHSESYDAGDYSHWVVATDVLGCSDTQLVDFKVKPLPDASFTWTPEFLDFDNPTATFTANTHGLGYEWQADGNTEIGTDSVFILTRDEVGDYRVSLTTEKDGCRDSLTQYISFRDAFRYYEITSFSPNDDGLNDRYKPYISGIKALSYTIYNTYGQIVYAGDMNASGWDGTYGGKDAPTGTYLVTLAFQNSQGRWTYTQSSVYLLR